MSTFLIRHAALLATMDDQRREIADGGLFIRDLAESRQAMLLARLRAASTGAPLSRNRALPLLSARQALELATRGGGAVLGREDVGALAPGRCADFIAVDLDRLEYAGAWHDPVAALVLCASVPVDYTVVGGRVVVEKGRLRTLDLPLLVERHNRAAARLIEDA